MANRRYTSQFSYSFERMPVRLMAAFTQTGSTGAAASVTTQGITLTAVTMGSAGNSITIAFTPGATAGSEVVSVMGSAISVQISTGVSSVTQVRTAINLSAAAAALVTATGTSASTVATASAVALTSGADTSFTVVNAQGNTSTAGVASGMTLSQTATGVFKISLADPYASLLCANISIQKASATDIKAQIASAATAFGSAQAISFRTIAVATPTNLASGDVIYLDINLRNSA